MAKQNPSIPAMMLIAEVINWQEFPNMMNTTTYSLVDNGNKTVVILEQTVGNRYYSETGLEDKTR